MFGKSNGNAADANGDSSSAQDVKRSIVGHSAASEAYLSSNSGNRGECVIRGNVKTTGKSH